MEEGIKFKRAGEKDFDKIHQFNHRIFAQEIEQHPINADGSLIDKFHNKNIYFIAEKDDEIIGMICVHYTPPFSIEGKCLDFKNIVDDYNAVAEVRLFGIDPKYRKKSFIAWALIYMIVELLTPKGINIIAISGIEIQRRTYSKFGFVDISDPVTVGKAVYYPMILTRQRFLDMNSERMEKIASIVNNTYTFDPDFDDDL